MNTIEVITGLLLIIGFLCVVFYINRDTRKYIIDGEVKAKLEEFDAEVELWAKRWGEEDTLEKTREWKRDL